MTYAVRWDLTMVTIRNSLANQQPNFTYLHNTKFGDEGQSKVCPEIEASRRTLQLTLNQLTWKDSRFLTQTRILAPLLEIGIGWYNFLQRKFI